MVLDCDNVYMGMRNVEHLSPSDKIAIDVNCFIALQRFHNEVMTYIILQITL